MPSRAGRVGDGVLFAAIMTAWGFNYLFVRAGLGFWEPLWLAAGRSTLGLVIVAGVALALPSIRGRLSWAGRRDALLLGLPNTGLFFGLWFSAAGSVLPGEAAVVVYTFPLWVALLGQPFLGHRWTPLTLGAVALGFAGVILITEPWRVAGTALPLVAVAELLAGSVSWAVGTVWFQKRFRGPEMQEANLYQLLGGSVALLGAAAVLEPGLPPPTGPVVPILLWLGVVGTAGAYMAWFALLGRTRAATLSAYTFLVPVVALSASIVLLGERLEFVQVAGVVAVLVSIYGTGRGAQPLEEPPG
ncbi:MAG TPA: DMT family transporter [Thermoplasmata archaeon]|nr:DMT family transporter [Thermoplasmata archaeon]